MTARARARARDETMIRFAILRDGNTQKIFFLLGTLCRGLVTGMHTRIPCAHAVIVGQHVRCIVLVCSARSRGDITACGTIRRGHIAIFLAFTGNRRWTVLGFGGIDCRLVASVVDVDVAVVFVVA